MQNNGKEMCKKKCAARAKLLLLIRPIVVFHRFPALQPSPLMYRSNRSFNMPPPDIPRAFDTFAVPGRREFDYQSLPGGGEFDPHALGVGNLN